MSEFLEATRVTGESVRIPVEQILVVTEGRTGSYQRGDDGRLRELSTNTTRTILTRSLGAFEVRETLASLNQQLRQLKSAPAGLVEQTK